MCKYCATDEFGDSISENLVDTGYEHGVGISMSVFPDDQDSILSGSVYIENTFVHGFNVPIRYCPKCGRKLSKD